MESREKFILDINNKNLSAWEVLYDEFYPALCSYSERILKDKDIVEDIVQDCLISLWNSSNTFMDIKNLTSWLYKVVYNKSLNELQHRNIVDKKVAQLQEQTEEFDYMEAAIEETVIAKLRLTIENLPPQQKKIIELTLQDLKIKDIAIQLNVSENTVKMQKKRAYANIRTSMGSSWALLVFHFLHQL